MARSSAADIGLVPVSVSVLRRSVPCPGTDPGPPRPATQQPVRPYAGTGKRPKVAVWTPEQTGAFLDYASGDRLYALYHLVTFRGLRRGEAVGLPWAEVDLVGRNLAVSEQIVQVGYLTETGPPKADSARVVVLDEDSVAVLQSHKARQNQERLAWGPGWVDSGLVFTREDGSALHPEYVSRHFERLARNAGLPPVRLHDLRHGAATLALAGGRTLKLQVSNLRALRARRGSRRFSAGVRRRAGSGRDRGWRGRWVWSVPVGHRLPL